MRIGYQGPNARLAATVGTITKSCAAAGIGVSNVTLDTSGPQALKDGKIDVLLASTGGASGSGSTGSSAMDAYDLHSGNGNNLSGYANPQVDGIIGALAVSGDPAERVRLLAEGAPVLWGDMPTLPLYRQQRTLLMSKKMYAVEREPNSLGCGLEHGPMGFDAVTSIQEGAALADLIASLTREVADFPQPGVQFKDLTPLFADRTAMRAVIDALAGIASGVDLVAGIESRGFLVAAAVAARLGTGVLSIRKEGKLPPPVLREKYTREYGPAAIEIPADGHRAERHAASSSSTTCWPPAARSVAANRLLERARANVTGAAVIVELTALDGRAAIAPLPVHSLSRAFAGDILEVGGDQRGG